MKNKMLYLIILLVTFINCNAEEIDFEKITEYPLSGVYLEKDNLVVDYPYLYVANSYGIEIYEIDANNNVELITRFPLIDDARVLEIKNDIAYVVSVSYPENHYRLYKIDISNIYEPVILDSIFVDNENCRTIGDIYNDYIIIFSQNENYDKYYSIYKIPELEFIQNYPINYYFIKISDSLAINCEYGYIYSIYDFSDPENISIIDQIDLSAGGFEHYANFKTINDSVIVGISNEGLDFWNVTDITNWEFISGIYSQNNEFWGDNICIIDDDYIIIQYIGSGTGVKSINISNINEPSVVDNMQLTSPYFYISSVDIDAGQNSIFLGTYQKIHQFVQNNGIFEEQIEIYDNYLSYGGIIKNNLLYMTFDYGLKIYDISIPENITLVNSLYENQKMSAIVHIDDLLAVIDYTNNTIKVLDISIPENPVIRNEIYINNTRGNLSFNNNGQNIYYIEKSPQYLLKKYDISEPGNSFLEFTHDLNSPGYGFIYNDYFYYLASNNPNGPDLKIIDGLANNSPELVTTIIDFAAGYPDYPNTFIQNCDSCFYLACYTGNIGEPFDSTSFFEIESPTEINYKFTANYRCNGDFSIKDNYLYISGQFSHIYVYDYETAVGVTEPIAHYQDYGNSQSCVLNEQDESKYLYHFQSTAFSVYNVIDNGIGELLETDMIALNHPNPFTTSTTISFTTKNPLVENQQIEIFNIKGQKVKTPQVAPSSSRTVSAVWNGKNEQGKPAAQGVYFYKVETDEKIIVKKMLLIR